MNGASILPDGWIEAATRSQAETGDPFRGYGYQWWTEADGRYNAVGIHGQSIHVGRDRRGDRLRKMNATNT